MKNVQVELAGSNISLFVEVILDLGAQAVSVDVRDDESNKALLHAWNPSANDLAQLKYAKVYFQLPSEADAASVIEGACSIIGQSSIPLFEEFEVSETEDWEEVARGAFRPVKVSDRLWVLPSWLPPPDPAAINILLTPGMGFGMGTHATTSMCLDRLVSLISPSRPCSVLDYGCGSGVLAIAAVRLGASHAVAVDVDKSALANAVENARLNGLGDDTQLTFGEPHILKDDEQFDVVVANIVSSVLISLCPTLRRHCRPSSTLILSGIMAGEAQTVRDVFSVEFSIEDSYVSDGWVCIIAQPIGKEHS